MTIVACLAWYDEPIEFLDRCVRSLAGFADKLIAYDGAWELFPDGKTMSPADQILTILRAANDIGIDGHLVSSKPWASQVAKRDALMRDASKCGDWLFVIDGDEYVADAYAAHTRAILGAACGDVATVVCENTTDLPVGYRAPIRRFYRAPVSVDLAHNGYRTADGRWLHGDPAYVELERAIDTPLLLHHERGNRSAERNARAAGYRKNRRAVEAEDWTRERALA